MSRTVDVIQQRSVACPSCDAKPHALCQTYIGAVYHTRRPQPVNCVHIQRKRKFSREMAEWNRAQTEALLRSKDGN